MKSNIISNANYTLISNIFAEKFNAFVELWHFSPVYLLYAVKIQYLCDSMVA